MSEPTCAHELYPCVKKECIVHIETINKKLILLNIHTFNGFPLSR